MLSTNKANCSHSLENWDFTIGVFIFFYKWMDMMKNEYENTLRPAKNQVASPQLLPARWTNERFHFAAHFCVGHPMLLCTDSFYLLISRSSEKNKLIIHSLCMLFAVIGGRRERHKVTLPLSLGLIMIDCIALTLAHFHFRTFMRPGSDSARIYERKWSCLWGWKSISAAE